MFERLSRLGRGGRQCAEVRPCGDQRRHGSRRRVERARQLFARTLDAKRRPAGPDDPRLRAIAAGELPYRGGDRAGVRRAGRPVGSSHCAARCSPRRSRQADRRSRLSLPTLRAMSDRQRRDAARGNRGARLIAHLSDAIRRARQPRQGFEPKLRRAFGLPTAGSGGRCARWPMRSGQIDDRRRWRSLPGSTNVMAWATSLGSADTLRWVGWRVSHRRSGSSISPCSCAVFHKVRMATGARALSPAARKADPADIALADDAVRGRLPPSVAVAPRCSRRSRSRARHLRVGARLGAAYARPQASRRRDRL